MAGTVERLEQALCVWEDSWSLHYAVAQLDIALGRQPPLPFVGPLANFQRLRKYLLSLNGTNLADFDSDSFVGHRFIATKELLKRGAQKGSLITFPGGLASWTINSRRVFHLSAELQTLLAATSLEGIQWKDVKFPFDSFALTLEIPIQDKDGHKYDCILFGKEPDYDSSVKGKEILACRLFSTQFSAYLQWVGVENRKNISENIRLKKWHKVAQLIKQIEDKAKSTNLGFWIAAFFFDEESIANRNVTESVFDIGRLSRETAKKADLWPHFDVASRIIVGLCLYLQTLPSSSSARSEWKKHDRTGKKPDPRAITNDAQVCTVSCTHKLTAEEREITGSDEQMRKKSLYELCAHFRRGHWRRPPGQGHIPDAPRIVWVRPTLVRRDRLAEGQLPGGAEAILR